MKRTLRFTYFLLLIAAFSTNASAQDVKRTFDVKPGSTLRLDIETGGDITIIGADQSQISVDLAISGRDRDDVITEFDDSGDGLYITVEFDHRNSRASVDLEITVPSVFNLRLDSNGGDMTVEGVEGTIEGRTMGGDLEFSRLKGDIDFSTMGGSIDIEDSTLDGSVDTMGGDITLINVQGDVKGSTMGGEVTYENSGGRGMGATDEIRIETMGGEINVDDAAAGANLHTMGGDIRLKSARDHVKAVTMGGEIRIDEIDGWVEASTMGGDVDVYMVGDASSGDRHVDIESMGGDIVLSVPADLSMNLDLEITVTRNADDDFGIESDFDITVERSKTSSTRKRRRDYRIYSNSSVAGGKHRIKVRTINGNIYLKKAR